MRAPRVEDAEAEVVKVALARAQQIIAQRAVDLTSQVIEGLEQLDAQAGRGDPAASQLLARLGRVLEARRPTNGRTLVIPSGRRPGLSDG